MANPPSTKTLWPVIKEAAGLLNHNTSSATFSGLANLPSEHVFSMAVFALLHFLRGRNAQAWCLNVSGLNIVQADDCRGC